MKAVLCAAGIGKRMHPFTIETPKPLLPIGEKTIIEYLLESLSAVGIVEVIVVVGYKAEMIKNKLGHQYGNCKITYVYNPDFATTNNIYSLWLARGLVDDGMIFFNCDIVFNDNLLRYVVADKRADSLAADFEIVHVDDTLKALFENGRLVDIGKRIEMSNSWAMGIYKLSQATSQKYFEIAEKLFLEDENNKNISFVVPLKILSKEVEIGAVPVFKGGWAEVDIPEDYAYAQANIKQIRKK